MSALLLLAVLAGAPEPAWVQVADGDVKVFSRAQPGGRVAELRAEMVMAATPLEVREVLLDDEYARHSPYVGEFRTVETPNARTWVRYTRLDLPVVDDRDYFIRIHLDSDLKPNGKGVFHTSWTPWGLDRPARHGVVRVTTNTGYWDVRTAHDGVHATVEYYVSCDPGGAIPAWAVDAANKKALPEVMHALEKEALRRRAEKQKARK